VNDSHCIIASKCPEMLDNVKARLEYGMYGVKFRKEAGQRPRPTCHNNLISIGEQPGFQTRLKESPDRGDLNCYPSLLLRDPRRW
jgi:hypothetical protein